MRLRFRLAVLLLPACLARAEPSLDFLERFALPEQREAALRTLVPGSADHYYFHALHAQNTGDEQALAILLQDYRKRHPDSPGLRILENRRALLAYAKEPNQTLDYLRRTLSLDFSHQPIHPDEASTAPSVLDPALIDADKLIAGELARNPDSLGLITDEGLRLLQGRPLTKLQRRELLDRLDRPDFSGLVDLVVADLQEPDGGGFGSRKIHPLLFLTQLDALAEKMPLVRQNEDWVRAKLARLVPDNDVDYAHDRAEKRAYLNRARAFADPLDPKFNTLKASILHELLVLDRAEGAPNPDTFLAFIRLPRPSPLARTTWLDQAPLESRVVPDAEDYLDCHLPPVPADDRLVREYLEHFLAAAPDWSAYAPYFEEDALKRIFATAHLLAGNGDPDRMAALLPPEELSALRERVDIDLLPTNPEFLRPEDPVRLQVALKNVPDLRINVYEINAANVCRQTLANPDISLDVDGLVPTRESNRVSNEPPLRRVHQTLEFPELQGAGVWLIELVGNGKASRALVRKGRLIALHKPTPLGHQFHILDHTRHVAKTARLWLAGRTYEPDKTGAILVPYSTKSDGATAVLELDGLAEVFTFLHEEETYDFDADFHLDREQLLPGSQATLLVRVRLAANDEHPMDLGALEEMSLIITCKNLKGVATREETKIDKLDTHAEFTHTFRVPEQTVMIECELEAKIQPRDQNEKRHYSDLAWFPLNGLQKKDATEVVNLTCVEGAYQLDVRGLNGETRAGRAVQVRLEHRWLQEPITATLSTDPEGRVRLGALPGIAKIHATSPSGQTYSWTPTVDEVSLPERLQTAQDAPIAIALPDHATPSLSSLRGSWYLADETPKLRAKDRLLLLQGLAPGDYELQILPSENAINLRVTRGVEVEGHLVTGQGADRLDEHVPLALSGPSLANGELSFTLANATAFTRVHALATRFVPDTSMFHSLVDSTVSNPFLPGQTLLPLEYDSGRALGDEVRYVRDRKHVEKFAGVMLARPGLLLSPWDRDSTADEISSFKGSYKYKTDPMMDINSPVAMSGVLEGGESTSLALMGYEHSDYLDFLAQPSFLLANLKPDANGVVKIKVADLKGLPILTVLALDPGGAMQRTFSTADSPVALRDVRLPRSLTSEPALTEQQRISARLPGEKLTLDTEQDADMQVFDTLARTHAYFQTLRPDEALAEFEPLTRWAALPEAERIAFASAHVCHELSFFLHHKDRPFFDAVLRPYLANKRDKTFLDHWLLDADLAAYTTPWSFARLNAAEQALLARRLRERAPMTARLLGHLVDQTPPDRTAWNNQFEAGLAVWDTQENGLRNNLATFGPADPLSIIDANDASDPQMVADRKVMLAKMTEAQVNVPKTKQQKDSLARLDSLLGELPPEHRSKEASEVIDTILANYKGRKFPTEDDFSRLEEEVRRSKQAPRPGASQWFGTTALGREGRDGANRYVEYANADLYADVAKGKEDHFSFKASERGRKADEFVVAGKAMDFDSDGDGTVALGQSLKFIEEQVQGRALARQIIPLPDRQKHQLYRKPEATKEWAENNYWKLTPDQQLADLIKPNRFWQDYASAAPDQPFLTSHLAEASGSFAESMLALAVLDLPFEGKKHDLKREGNQVTFTAASPCIVFHKEIRPAGTDANLQPVVLAQKFFDHQDRSRTVEGQQVDKYIAEGFVKGRIYGGRVIVTNPTGLPRKLDVLVQIPRGAIPVQSGFLTREFPVDVAAFGTQQIEYLFYFPQAGTYESFPAMASENDALAAKAEGLTFTVLEKPAGQDETSWDFVSQRAAPEAVLKYLRERNVVEIDLGRIAWRMKDKAFFAQTLDTLRDRQVYHDTLWSYGVQHNDSSALREWIAHNAFANGCGDWFVSALLKFDPIERLTYEHLEYAPLVNPRAHPVGGKRTILNEVLRMQYTRLVKVLGHKPALTGEDRLAMTYYLLLQDRIADGLAQLAQVKDDEVSEKLQLAYLRAWAALAQGDAAAARKHVAPHAKTPVARWQKLFQDALTQLDEIEGKAVQAAADREGNEAAAASEPVLELKAEGTTLLVRHRLLEKFELNFYPMDIEVLFSKKPFLQEVGGTFSFIRPVRSEAVVIAKDGPAELKIALPDAFKGRNVTVEAVAGGLRKTVPVFAGDVQVEVIANYGQVRVTDAAGKPLAKAYVKVYGRKEGGEAVFYKDGYTDLRGRFDYASLNSDDLDNIERFALLVLDDAHGAAIREAEPPKR